MTNIFQRRVHPGQTITVELPFSEVCMHMRVAGRIRSVKLLDERSAQILNEDGSNYSAPITFGEAGIYQDALGFYAYTYTG